MNEVNRAISKMREDYRIVRAAWRDEEDWKPAEITEADACIAGLVNTGSDDDILKCAAWIGQKADESRAFSAKIRCVENEIRNEKRNHAQAERNRDV